MRGNDGGGSGATQSGIARTAISNVVSGKDINQHWWHR